MPFYLSVCYSSIVDTLFSRKRPTDDAAQGGGKRACAVDRAVARRNNKSLLQGDDNEDDGSSSSGEPVDLDEADTTTTVAVNRLACKSGTSVRAGAKGPGLPHDVSLKKCVTFSSLAYFDLL